MFLITHAHFEAAIAGAKFLGGYGSLHDSVKGGLVSGGSYSLPDGDRVFFEECDHHDGRKTLRAAIYSASTGYSVGRPLGMERAVDAVRNMDAEEVMAVRRWPAWFTVDQARAQLEHEAQGCPRPIADAEWDGHSYQGPSWPGHTGHGRWKAGRNTARARA